MVVVQLLSDYQIIFIKNGSITSGLNNTFEIQTDKEMSEITPALVLPTGCNLNAD